jgi:hypothetical protein
MRNGNQGVVEMSYIEKFWRPATAADVARVMAGETVEARFRDCAKDEWKGLALAGWSRGSESDSLVWASAGLVHYRYCQVYAPPQWYLDKPEPGEGYRLLAKFPDEALQPGDEAFEASGRWSTSYLVKSFGVQVEGVWYRRRIEQPKPEPKHYVLQVGDSVETPSGHLIKIADRPTEQMHYKLQVGDSVETPSGRQAIVTEHGFEVT